MLALSCPMASATCFWMSWIWRRVAISDSSNRAISRAASASEMSRST
jgi:hypothetical protein